MNHMVNMKMASYSTFTYHMCEETIHQFKSEELSYYQQRKIIIFHFASTLL